MANLQKKAAKIDYDDSPANSDEEADRVIPTLSSNFQNMKLREAGATRESINKQVISRQLFSSTRTK